MNFSAEEIPGKGFNWDWVRRRLPTLAVLRGDTPLRSGSS